MHPATRCAVNNVRASRGYRAHVGNLFTINRYSSINLRNTGHLNSGSLTRLIIFNHLTNRRTARHTTATNGNGRTTVRTRTTNIRRHLGSLIGRSNNRG